MQRQLLVADDEPGFRTLVRKVATAEQWDVVECADGAELLNTLPGLSDQCLLLVDIMMPQVDGIEAIRHMADAAHDRPVYFVTGGLEIYGDMVRHLSKAKGLNLQGVLQKPLSIGDLRDTLAKHSEADQRA